MASDPKSASAIREHRGRPIRRPRHHHPRRARAQSEERRPDDPARQARRLHRACPARANPRSPSTRSTPKASAATSKSLSAYARQFLEMMQKPDVDQIDGLSPAISIEQKTTSQNPRSTVGTVTEIYDYMRLLWARVGIPYSPATGLPIESQTVSQMVDRVLALPERTRLYLLAPVVRGRKGEYRKEIADFMKRGFQRLKIDGEFYEIADAPALDKKLKHDIEVVVDRIVVRPDMAAPARREFRDGAGARRRHRGRRVRATRPTPKDETAPPGGSSSPRSSPARSRASPSPRSSRGCSRSTIRSAPARSAAASASQHEGRSRPDRAGPQAVAAARRDRALGASRPRPITCRRWRRSAGTTSFRLDARLGEAARGGAAT